MVLVECLRYAPLSSNESGKPRVLSTGIWPFTVYMEQPEGCDMKKDT